jgi:hypothetical protein
MQDIINEKDNIIDEVRRAYSTLSEKQLYYWDFDMVDELYQMRFIEDLSTSTIAKRLNMSDRAIRNRLDMFGWGRDRFEAARHASKHTDRTNKIIASSKKTKIKGESNLENKVRRILEFKFKEKGYFPIIGINTNMENNKEIDIPCFVMNENTGDVLLFGVETCGDYWHKNHTTKNFIINNDNFLLFEVWQGSSTKKYPRIEKQVDDIIGKVCEIIDKIGEVR